MRIFIYRISKGSTDFLSMNSKFQNLNAIVHPITLINQKKGKGRSKYDNIKFSNLLARLGSMRASSANLFAETDFEASEDVEVDPISFCCCIEEDDEEEPSIEKL